MTKYIFLLLISSSALAADFTNRRNLVNACQLFAIDAYQASVQFQHGVALPDLLEVIDSILIPDSTKQRAAQAIQFVWDNQITDQTLAYALAMGICLEPKKEMPPADPWLASFRTSKEYF